MSGQFLWNDVPPGSAESSQQPGLLPAIAENMAPPSSTQEEGGPQIFMDIRIGDRQGKVVGNGVDYCSQNPPSYLLSCVSFPLILAICPTKCNQLFDAPQPASAQRGSGWPGRARRCLRGLRASS